MAQKVFALKNCFRHCVSSQTGFTPFEQERRHGRVAEYSAENANSFKARHNAQTGFTLIELILSITILSMVLVTIYATLSMGSRTWEKGERDIERIQRMRIVMDLLSREIKSAFPYKVTPSELDTHKEFYAFEGKKDSLSFVSCVPLHGGSGKLSWLTFWVEDGEGLAVVERDALRTDIFKERETIDKDEMVVLDAQVIAIGFEYYRLENGTTEEAAEEEVRWEEAWDAEEEGTLPQAVKVTVTFLEEAARKEAEDEVYTRELVIPLMIHTDVMKGGGGFREGESPTGGETGGAGASTLGGRTETGRGRSSRSGSGTRRGSEQEEGRLGGFM